MTALNKFGRSGIRVGKIADKGFVRSALRNWLLCVETYNEFHRHYAKKTADVPYWHREESQVSVLAGAIWHAGGVALQDYDGKKRGGGTAKIDLYIASDRVGFEAEAKVLWPARKTKKSSAWRNQIDNAINAAKSQSAKNLITSDHRLSVCFVCPKIEVKQGKWKDNRLAYIDPFVSDVLQYCLVERTFNAAAWIFPEMDKATIDAVGKKRYFYPGCILLIDYA